ncbi:MAG TPA: DUF1553 domain-containing protein, partial [Pirellulaceae bacterium]|nr:DUF1553 domain-containing protein [Pirellulaceae bacterium]
LSGFLLSSHRQQALLDPSGQIESIGQKVESHRELANSEFALWCREMSLADHEHLVHNLSAAIQLLREHPRPSQEGTIVLSGESLAVRDVASGRVESMGIGPQSQTVWEGDRHLVWFDGQIGDSAVFEFETPESGAYQLCLDLTCGVDFGVVEISIDDRVVKPAFDAYAPSLTKASDVSLGIHGLSGGVHRLGLRIIGKHPRANSRHMVGLDQIVLVPKQSQETRDVWESTLLPAFAEARQLNPQVIERLVRAVLDDRSLDDSHHPLSALRRLTLGPPDDMPPGFEGARRDLSLVTARRRVAESEADLFADFQNGIDGWFAHGWAFDQHPQHARMAADGSLIQPAVVSSRGLGDRFQGILYSPTFQIVHPQIHYRLRGRNCQVRVIVDGYTMDVFNPLLFEGLTFTVHSKPEFEWVIQSGDLVNHIGRSAHLQIVDLGDGWIEVDQIWFASSRDARGSHLRDNAGLLNERQDADQDSVSQTVQLIASELMESLRRVGNLPKGEACSQQDVAIANWLFRHELDDMFRRASSHDQSNRRREDPQVDSKPPDLADSHRNRVVAHVHEMSIAGNQLPAPRYAMAMTGGTPLDGTVYVRGNPKVLGAMVPRRDLMAFAALSESDISVTDRLALAQRWTCPDNPLIARVFVNRVWHHLMRRGIVSSVDDFGVMGDLPTHPELLDYLALEFVADGWSIKRLIRRLVLTDSYQQSSEPVGDVRERDPDNTWLHAQRIKRLEGEAIRDAMLAISGQLNAQMYGPSVPCHLTEFMEGRGRPDVSGPLEGEGRRSIYLAVRRNFLNPLFLTFDTPAPFNTMGRRNVSNVPAQALTMMNDPLVHWCAARWAERLTTNTESIDGRVRRMYGEALSRRPTDDELAACREFLAQRAVSMGGDVDHLHDSVSLWTELCHVLLNTKDFIFLR